MSHPPGPSDETKLASQSGEPPATPAPASGHAAGRSSSGSHSGWLSTPHAAGGRFASGEILADRYRIVGLLGRGGMGEVYRADDLRLGQPVALKFLPEAVAGDPVRLAQFHNEVRTARQISHRNVCRVYDIGEADGRIFLTMEYVDGEDLAALLRRIGRFPHDKALEIARQLCAGLAAAHEQGVLHRDLKPANVMLDGEGRVRITDFGLAGVAGDIQDIRAGTPAYMAPEQLAGREVSVRSDLFALGLVLYEVFTGRRVFDAKNVNELLQAHDRGPSLIPPASSRASAGSGGSGVQLDPAVERVIAHCLQRDPALRPASAIAVAAALPGGDPLAAALAAGETPSPEMIVDAGAREALRPAIGLAMVAYVIVLLAAILVLGERNSIFRLVPFDKPPDVLQDRAQAMLASFGYTERPMDTWNDFTMAEDYFRYAAQRQGADRWRELTTGRPGTALFWHRTSPRLLAPGPMDASPEPYRPPLNDGGMTLTILDTTGRLIEFHAVPPQLESTAAGASASPAAANGASPSNSTTPASPANAGATPAASASEPTVPVPAGQAAAAASAAPSPRDPVWAPLFTAADLPPDRFTPATPEWTPPVYADRRAAWTGTLPELGATPVRVEAAAYRGRPVLFQIIYPWSRAARDAAAPVPVSPVGRAISLLAAVTFLAVVLWAMVVGRRNARAGRGDAEGAFRLARLAAVCILLVWIVGAKHVGSIDVELQRFIEFAGLSLFYGAAVWLFYLALEPSVRRFWPAGLVGWNRLLAGHWRDPLVGQHILAGVACGVTYTLAVVLAPIVSSYFAGSPAIPRALAVNVIANGRMYAATVFNMTFSALISSLFLVLVYAFARRFARRDLFAVPIVLLIFGLTVRGLIVGHHLASELTVHAAVTMLIIFIMRRFGLLTTVVTFFVFALLRQPTPLTTNFSAWYASLTIASLAIVFGIALYGYVCSRGGEPLFGRAFADE